MFISIDNVVRTNSCIDKAIEILDPYFKGLPCTVSSGLRSVEKQLEIIVTKARRWSLTDKYEEFDGGRVSLFRISPAPVAFEFGWQRTWSEILDKGDIVNPPYPAKSLGLYKHGQEIGISNHMRGLAFDISTIIGDKDFLIEIAIRVAKACHERPDVFHGHRAEPVNEAVHVDLVPC